MIYDQGKDYLECLKQILIARRKMTRTQIIAQFPLFASKFPEMIDIIYKRVITHKDVQTTTQLQLYDGKTFAQCVYELFVQTHEFDAVGKRASSETMPDWVAWYEGMMYRYAPFYDNFKTIMRNICEGRAAKDPVTCMLITSIEMAHRGAITQAEQSQIFNEFVTRKGVYAQQIAALHITEAEWTGGIEEYFATHNTTTTTSVGATKKHK